MRGVEDDPLEHHVVEADALAQPDAARRELGGQRGQPHLEELEHGGRVWARAAARRSSGVAPGSPSTSAAMRSKSSVWRSSSRRWR